MDISSEAKYLSTFSTIASELLSGLLPVEVYNNGL